MDRIEWARTIFHAVDDRNVDGFCAFLAEDVVFRFGNAEPVRGRAAVGEAVAGFFASIAGLRHDVRNVWDTGDAVICHGAVTYERHDASTLTVPFAVFLRLAGDLITDYSILCDQSALYRDG